MVTEKKHGEAKTKRMVFHGESTHEHGDLSNKHAEIESPWGFTGDQWDWDAIMIMMIPSLTFLGTTMARRCWGTKKTQ